MCQVTSAFHGNSAIRSNAIFVIAIVLTLAVLAVAQPDDLPPDWIVYQAEGGIHRTRTDGSDRALIAEVEALTVAWSPDGEGLVFSFYDGREAAAYLYRMQVDGTARQRLSNEPVVNLSHLVWSPDGEWIVYTSCPDGFMHDCDLYRIRPDGTGHARFTESPGYNQHPSWSPDGEWLLFSAYTGQARHTYRIRPDGSDMDILTESTGGGWSATWSPDGAWIVFNFDYDLYRMRPDGSGVERLTENTNVQGDVVWSPNSTWILFEARTEGANSLDIYLLRADGSDQQRLTESGGAGAAWSPDGKWIVFHSRRNQNGDIFLMRADGSDLRQLTQSPVGERDPQWLADDGKPTRSSSND